MQTLIYAAPAVKELRESGGFQNLTPIYAEFWRMKSISALKGLKWHFFKRTHIIISIFSIVIKNSHQSNFLSTF